MTSDIRDIFRDPPREHGMMPFWMWNDDLDENEIKRQIREFHANGFGGFIPHARVGLSRRVGYLTDEWFRLVRVAVEEAASLGMKVVLYDEASYPSGSAGGRVVASNPDFAAKCIFPASKTVEGPAKGYWRPIGGRAMCDRIVCVTAMRHDGENHLDPATIAILEQAGSELYRYDLPDGTWQLTAVISGFSGGTIRGAHDEEDDGHAQAPPAGDLLNPEAVATFIRLTHDQYFENLSGFFGETIVAMFTDEPNPMGRGARRGTGAQAWTDGFLEDMKEYWDEDVRRWLPALWNDMGPRTEDFRAVFKRAVQDRMEWVFYGAQSHWCDQHGIALTGHPAASNEMAVLRQFQWPGQDIVWRYVEPGNDSGLTGPHSVAAKCAASAAALAGRERNTSEALGAFGWHLTLDEAKWVLDWHLVRGNNLFFPHAVFYSIRDRRSYESEPDLGIHNTWWPRFGMLSDYTRRVCWAISDGQEICDVAILTDSSNMAWDAAGVLLQEQIDFLYVDESAVRHGRISGDSITLGNHDFRAVICDPQSVPESTREVLSAFEAAGGLVVSTWTPGELAGVLTRHLGRDVDWSDGNGDRVSDLRALHYKRDGEDYYYLVNEGEESFAGDLSLGITGGLELMDPMSGTIRPWQGSEHDGRLHTTLNLERRQGLILRVTPGETPMPGSPEIAVPGCVLCELSGPWTVTLDGDPVDIPCPGDWAQLESFETFAGSVDYETSFEVRNSWLEQRLYLDLGHVGDIADVRVNGADVGTAAWSPWVIDVTDHVRTGANHLRVTVTNSIANRLEGRQMPSGILGSVVLRQEAGDG